MRISGKGRKFADGREIDMEPVDDQESMKIINMAIDLEINLFDNGKSQAGLRVCC